MYRYICSIIVFFAFILTATKGIGQNFNPYQNAYQGWSGDKIKKASPIRAFLNKFSVNASVGYGRTFYNFNLTDNVLENGPLNNSGNASIVLLGDYGISGDSINYSGAVNWFNYPEAVTGSSYLGGDSTNNILYYDSAEIGYSGSGFNVPFQISVQLDIDRFRIGGGISYEILGINQLKPKGQGTYPYVPNFSTSTMFRYFFTIGGKVYHLLGWDYYADIEIGKVKYGKQYDKTALQNGLFFNLGIPMEYEMSEYFWIFVRPSFEYKNYTMAVASLDGTDGSGASSLQFNQPAFYLNVGVRLKMPEIKRCPVKSCRTQLKHVHGGQEFRGQAFYKKQNPKIGELYPELEMYKRKNRDKSGTAK